jgi:hypothetical protein
MICAQTRCPPATPPSHDERIGLVLQPARALAKRRGELADVRFDEYKIDGRQPSLLGGEA